MADLRIPLLVSSDRLYLKHALVMLASAAEKTKAGLDLIFVPGETEAAEVKRFLEAAQPYLTSYRILTDLQVRVPETIGGFRHVSKQALNKFVIPQALGDLDRVLYLDADLVVQGDLAELWANDLGGNGLGAVENPHYTRWDVLPIAKTPGYFNSGVMLIDLEHWRRTDATQRCLDALVQYDAQRKTADQEILNIVFSGAWQPLDPRWNCQVNVASWFEAKGIGPDEAKIVHYTGSPKPWHYPRPKSKWDEPYRRAARRAKPLGPSLLGYPVEDNWVRVQRGLASLGRKIRRG